MSGPRLDRGVWAALAAAALFGAGAPFAKLLLADTSAWLLAAILYLGSGIGLAFVRRVRRAQPVRPTRASGAGSPVQRLPAACSARCC
jgi:drug/metabolite transporter (DMT)-like permease